MLRGRRQERREDRSGGGSVHYRMRQRLVSIGDDFWIQNDRGERVFKIDGRALRLRSTLLFEDAGGHELARIQERMLRVRDTMEIEGPGGESLATVEKAMIAPLRERWTVRVRGGPDLSVQGSVLDHEYAIGEGRDRVAQVSKRWFRVADTYGVEIGPGRDDALLLAVTAAIDMMAHAGR